MLKSTQLLVHLPGTNKGTRSPWSSNKLVKTVPLNIEEYVMSNSLQHSTNYSFSCIGEKGTIQGRSL